MNERTEKDKLKRGLVLFVFRIYKQKSLNDFQGFQYAEPEKETEEAFIAYNRDLMFRGIYETLKSGFKELEKFEAVHE